MRWQGRGPATDAASGTGSGRRGSDKRRIGLGLGAGGGASDVQECYAGRARADTAYCCVTGSKQRNDTAATKRLGALRQHDTAAIPGTGGGCGGDKRRMRREGQAASVRAATRRRGGGDRWRICMILHNTRTRAGRCPGPGAAPGRGRGGWGGWGGVWLCRGVTRGVGSVPRLG